MYMWTAEGFSFGMHFTMGVDPKGLASVLNIAIALMY